MNPFGLDEMLQRYKPGQLGAGAVLGNPAGMQQAQEENLAALMEAYKRAQEQQQRGVGMMQPEYIQNSGALGALAMIAQAYAGKKLEKRAGETASDYASRIFEEQRKQEAAAAAAAEAAERAKWERTVELAQRRIDAANRRAELLANARIQAAKISASGQGGGDQLLSAEEAEKAGFAPGSVVQRDAKGKLSVLQRPDSRTESVDEQKAKFVAVAMADDARNFSAAFLGIPPEEAAALSAEEIRDRMKKQGRLSAGPVIGRIPGADLVLNPDLAAFSSAAAGKQARLNNPTGQVTDADFKIAARSVFGPDKPTEVNADLVYMALKRAEEMSGARPNQSGASSIDALLEKYR